VAGSAAQALSKAKLLGGELAFAVIDLGLPDVSGDVLARELKTLYPKLPIVIASGARIDVGAMFGNASNVAAIEKPYRLEDFTRAAVAVGARQG
jgi:FixJ family two-component response regulator